MRSGGSGDAVNSMTSHQLSSEADADTADTLTDKLGSVGHAGLFIIFAFNYCCFCLIQAVHCQLQGFAPHYITLEVFKVAYTPIPCVLLGGRVVRTLDLRSIGREFESWPLRYRVQPGASC